MKTLVITWGAHPTMISRKVFAGVNIYDFSTLLSERHGLMTPWKWWPISFFRMFRWKKTYEKLPFSCASLSTKVYASNRKGWKFTSRIVTEIFEYANFSTLNSSNLVF